MGDKTQAFPPLVLPCRPTWFGVAHLVQMAVHVARYWARQMRTENRVFAGDTDAARGARLLLMRRIESGLRSLTDGADVRQEKTLRIVFDQSIWAPQEPEAAGRIMEMCVATGSSLEFVRFRIDLEAPSHRCAHVMGSGPLYQWDPVDVFQVLFDEDDPTEVRDGRG